MDQDRCLSAACARFARPFCVLLALVLCLHCASPARAGSLKLGDAPYSGNLHHPFPTLTLSASLKYQANASNASVSNFVFHVNGVLYNATITPMQDGFTGSVDIPITQNPQRFICFATATVTWTYYMTRTESLSSLDSPSGPDTVGDGKSIEYILSNIKLKGLTWQNRLTDIHEHQTTYRPDADYPNASKPYHWRQYRDGNGAPTTTEDHGAVYIKGGAPSMELETEPLDSGVAVRANFKLDFTSGSGGGAIPANYPFNVYVPLGASKGTATCPPLKNEVNWYFAAVTLNFECQFSDGHWGPIYGRPSDSVTNLRLYTVLSQPGAPMTIPWEGVLMDSCRWAMGKSTAADVAQKLTTGFYFAQKAIYDPSDAFWRSDTAPHTFLLTRFLNGDGAVNPYGLRLVDCRDVSDYMCIVATSQGLSFESYAYNSAPSDTGEPEGDFTTNKLCRMGDDPAAAYDSSNYHPFGFTFHQIALSGGSVYDASNAHRYDLSGNGFRNPPFNWPLSGYWQTPVAPGTSEWNPVGLVALPNPSTPNDYEPYTPAEGTHYVPNVR